MIGRESSVDRRLCSINMFANCCWQGSCKEAMLNTQMGPQHGGYSKEHMHSVKIREDEKQKM